MIAGDYKSRAAGEQKIVLERSLPNSFRSKVRMTDTTFESCFIPDGVAPTV
jgi:hypothetical protein